MLSQYLEDLKPIVDQQLQTFFPEELSEEWLQENLGALNYGYDKIVFSKMTEPIWDLLNRGGKRWRPIFMMLVCDVLGGGSKVIDFIPVIEFIHNGTLMVDDVMDDSINRRGKPCTHKIYGVDVAINAGNMMYYLPYTILKKIDLDAKTKLQIHEVIAEEMIKLHMGQALDVNWHNAEELVTEDLYLQMCAYKTGTLSRLAAKIGALLGSATKRQTTAMVRFAEAIGVAFQIQDDILNITNTSWGKDFGDDISEGKRSLMVIHVLRIGTKKDTKRLLEILNMKTRNSKLIQEAIDIMKKYDALDYAKEKAKEIVSLAWHRLDPLIDESESKDKLSAFADYLIHRDV